MAIWPLSRGIFVPARQLRRRAGLRRELTGYKVLHLAGQRHYVNHERVVTAVVS